MFQQYSLYPHLSVYENLAFPLRSPARRLDKAEIDRRGARAAAKLLRIDHKLENRATRLSGGEMQRVAIGRALVRQPSIYLMDEPLSSLDAKLRANMRLELKRIQQELGATLLYVTHDQIEAMTMADRIGILKEGRLIQIGTPREIYTAPRNLHVATRLGQPAINLLPRGLLPDADAPGGTATIGARTEHLTIAKPRPMGMPTARSTGSSTSATRIICMSGSASTSWSRWSPPRYPLWPQAMTVDDPLRRPALLRCQWRPCGWQVRNDHPRPELTALIVAVARIVAAHADELTELDSAIGDGDHGTNMKRGFEAVRGGCRRRSAAKPLPEALKAIGTKLVMTVGGASGPLYGTLFMTLGKELGAAPDRAAVARALEAAVAAVKARGKSDVGQKTMLDVLYPVADALRAGKSVPELVAIANAEVTATGPRKAIRGRASFLGDRSIGHVDPGARSSALILEAVAGVLK